MTAEKLDLFYIYTGDNENELLVMAKDYTEAWGFYLAYYEIGVNEHESFQGPMLDSLDVDGEDNDSALVIMKMLIDPGVAGPIMWGDRKYVMP